MYSAMTYYKPFPRLLLFYRFYYLSEHILFHPYLNPNIPSQYNDDVQKSNVNCVMFQNINRTFKNSQKTPLRHRTTGL